MIFTFPSDTADSIDAIRGAIGRDVTFSIPTISACSVCTLDPITNTSTDSFCTTCSGEYWIETYTPVVVSAHVTWGYSEQLGWVTGGQLAEGDCRVQIKYTTVNLNAVDTAKFVTVDGKKLTVIKKILRGVKQLNRILVDLKELDE